MTPSQGSSRTLGGNAESPLGPYLWAIRAHPLVIAAVVIVAVLVSVAVIETRTATYKATAEVLVTPLSEGAASGAYAGLPIVTESPSEPARTLQTAASVLRSQQASEATAKALPGWSFRKVANAVEVEPRGETQIIAVTGSDRSAKVAAALANTYVQSALALRSKELSAEASALIEQLRARQKTLPSSDFTTLSQLAAQITSLVPVSNGHDPNFSLLRQASLPTTPNSSPKKLIVVLAILAGLALGIGAALGIEYLNRKVRDEEEALSIYPLPVLARVPPLPRGSETATSVEAMPPGVREAFRTLQVQLHQIPPGRGRAVMLTSASMADGKTASSINLALVLAASGQRVILLDFDLRKPDVGRRLGVDADVMRLFRSDATLEDVLVESRSAPGLSVLSSTFHGDVDPMLEALTRRLPDLMREACELADYVIIDTAPLGQVSDALRVAAAVDDVVLVVRPSNTDRTDLQRTRELLERMTHTPSGMVLVGEVSSGPTYGVYGLENGSGERPSGRRASLEGERSQMAGGSSGHRYRDSV